LGHIITPEKDIKKAMRNTFKEVGRQTEKRRDLKRETDRKNRKNRVKRPRGTERQREKNTKE
jgi:hypothetical protein